MFNYKNHSYKIYYSNIDNDKINFIHRKENVKIDDYLKDFMEKNWKKATSINPNLHNEKLYNILDIEKINGNINIYYDIIDFKLSIATKSPDYRGSYFTNRLSVDALILTADNKLLIGSDLKLYNGLQSWKIPGGHFDAEKDRTIFDCLKRETDEEIGKFDLYDSKILCIAKNINRHSVMAICLVKSKQTSAEILEYNRKNRDKIIDNNEMQIIKFLDYDYEKIQNFLNLEIISFAPCLALGLYFLINK